MIMLCCTIIISLKLLASIVLGYKNSGSSYHIDRDDQRVRVGTLYVTVLKKKFKE